MKWPFWKRSAAGDRDRDAAREKVAIFVQDEALQNGRAPEIIRNKIVSGADVDETAGSFGAFGLTLSNPIPVNGTTGRLLYLSSLRHAGKPIFFHKLGVLEGIDVFETVTADGAVWNLMYFDMYHPRKSRRAPDTYALGGHPSGFQQYGVDFRFSEHFPRGLSETVARYSEQIFHLPLAPPEMKVAEETVRFIRPQEHASAVETLEAHWARQADSYAEMTRTIVELVMRDAEHEFSGYADGMAGFLTERGAIRGKAGNREAQSAVRVALAAGIAAAWVSSIHAVMEVQEAARLEGALSREFLRLFEGDHPDVFAEILDAAPKADVETTPDASARTAVLIANAVFVVLTRNADRLANRDAVRDEFIVTFHHPFHHRLEDVYDFQGRFPLLEAAALPPDWAQYIDARRRDATLKEAARLFADEALQCSRAPEAVRDRILDGASVDEIPNAAGEFGFAVTNPIPVNGALGELIYLSSLRRHGGPILFHRIGSADEIDIYECVSVDGSAWSLLHFDIYHPRKSRRSPEGYSIYPSTCQFYGVNFRVPDFPRGMAAAIESLSARMLHYPIVPAEVTTAEETVQFVRPADHVRLLESQSVQTFRTSVTYSDLARVITAELMKEVDDLFPVYRERIGKFLSERGIFSGNMPRVLESPVFKTALTACVTATWTCSIYDAYRSHEASRLSNALGNSVRQTFEGNDRALFEGILEGALQGVVQTMKTVADITGLVTPAAGITDMLLKVLEMQEDDTVPRDLKLVEQFNVEFHPAFHLRVDQMKDIKLKYVLVDEDAAPPLAPSPDTESRT